MKLCLDCEKDISDRHHSCVRCIDCQKEYRSRNRCSINYRKEYNKEYWIKNKEKIKTYREINKEHIKNRFKKYCKKNQKRISEIKKEWHMANLEKRKRYEHNYYEKNKRKIIERNKKYTQTEKGKISHIKRETKRYRNLRWIEIFLNPFPEEIKVHYHHMNNLLVIPLPKEMHYNSLGKNHREKCINIIEELYMLDINKIFNDNI